MFNHKTSFSYENIVHCVKYITVGAFSDPCFLVYGQNRPYPGKYGSEKTGVLAHFTQWSLVIKDNFSFSQKPIVVKN